MATQISTATTFTPQEWIALCSLRARYSQDHDLFTGKELERLRFVRWLHETKRTTTLSPDGDE